MARIRKLLISKIATFGGGGGGGGSYVSVNGAETTSVATVAGSIAAGSAAWKIRNNGPATATVNGAALEVGQEAGGALYTDAATLEVVRCPAIAYDPNGSELFIQVKA